VGPAMTIELEDNEIFIPSPEEFRKFLISSMLRQIADGEQKAADTGKQFEFTLGMKVDESGQSLFSATFSFCPGRPARLVACEGLDNDILALLNGDGDLAPPIAPLP
jgi:hypothetical protein